MFAIITRHWQYDLDLLLLRGVLVIHHKIAQNVFILLPLYTTHIIAATINVYVVITIIIVIIIKVFIFP